MKFGERLDVMDDISFMTVKLPVYEINFSKRGRVRDFKRYSWLRDRKIRLIYTVNGELVVTIERVEEDE